MKNGFAHILIIILIAVVAVGVYFVSQGKISLPITKPSPTSEAVTTPTDNSTAEWETYKDEQNLFSFKYPRNLDLRDSFSIPIEPGRYGFLIVNAKNYFDVNKIPSCKTYSVSEEYVCLQKKNSTYVGGKEAISFSLTAHNKNAEGTFWIDVIQMDDPLMELIYSTPGTSKFDQVLESFEFID